MTPRPDGRRGLAVLTVLAVLVVGSTAAMGVGAFESIGQPSGDEILDRVEQRYHSAETITGTAEVTVSNESAERTATVEFAAAEPESARVVVTGDDRTYRAGSNGTVAWAVGPDRSAVWPVESLERGETVAMPGTTGDRLTAQGTPAMNESNVTATLADTPTVDGTSAYEVELAHAESNVTTTLWVAQDDTRVLRAVATDGTNRTVVDVQSTAFNVSVHESTFQPPTDRIALTTVDRYDDFDAAQTATDLTLPRPDGTFTEATVAIRQGETVVGQRYVLDGTNVSVVSTTATDRFDGMVENGTTATVDGQTARVTTARDAAVVTWTEDGVTTAVIVEGSTEAALEVARRL